MIGKLITLSEIDSTNKYAMSLIEQNMAENGIAVSAVHQTEGRGQRGKQWKSQVGQNITLSLLYKTERLKIEQQPLFNLFVATIICDFVKKFEETNICIKWPNDIYWCDNKAGGILVENKLQGQSWKWAVVGVGINVNQTTFEDFQGAVKPTSLKIIKDEAFDVSDLVKQLHQYFFENLAAFEKMSASEILQKFNERLYKRNEIVTLLLGEALIEAKILGANEKGELSTNQGDFTFGQVQWQIKPQ